MHVFLSHVQFKMFTKYNFLCCGTVNSAALVKSGSGNAEFSHRQHTVPLVFFPSICDRRWMRSFDLSSCVMCWLVHMTAPDTHTNSWQSSIIVSICPWNNSHFSQLCPPALGYDLLAQTTNILVLSTQPSGILYSNLANRGSLWSDIFAQWKLSYNWNMISFFSHNFY